MAKAMALPSSVVRVRLMTMGTTAILGEKRKSGDMPTLWPLCHLQASQTQPSPLPRSQVQEGAPEISWDRCTARLRSSNTHELVCPVLCIFWGRGPKAFIRFSKRSVTQKELHGTEEVQPPHCSETEDLVPGPSLTSCVTGGKLLSVSEAQCLSYVLRLNKEWRANFLTQGMISKSTK